MDILKSRRGVLPHPLILLALAAVLWAVVLLLCPIGCAGTPRASAGQPLIKFNQTATAVEVTCTDSTGKVVHYIRVHEPGKDESK